MKLKAAIASILAVGTLLFGGMAEAAIIFTGSIADWDALAGDTITDTVDNDASWTLNSYDAALADATVTISEIELLGVEVYSVVFSFDTLAEPLAGTYNVDYTMTLIGDESFVTVRLDSDVAEPPVTVTKQITGDANTTLTSTNGNPAGPNAISGQTINVAETFDVGSGGLLTGTTDTYRVAAVPEPMSLLLVGIGLVALGFVRRRSGD